VGWWPGQSYGFAATIVRSGRRLCSFFGFDSGFSPDSRRGWIRIGLVAAHRGRVTATIPGGVDTSRVLTPEYHQHYSHYQRQQLHTFNYASNGGIPRCGAEPGTRTCGSPVAERRMRMAVSTVDAMISAEAGSRFSPYRGNVCAWKNGRRQSPGGSEPGKLVAGERRRTPPVVARGGQNQQFFNIITIVRSKLRDPLIGSSGPAQRYPCAMGRFKPIVGNQGSAAGPS